MPDNVIESLQLSNLLSFPEDSRELILRPLNVIIGANASGKSNFLEGLALLQATPRDISVPFREGGGVGEWIFKGSPGAPARVKAHVRRGSGERLAYSVSFSPVSQHAVINDELIAPTELQDAEKVVPYFFAYDKGRPTLSVKRAGGRFKLHPRDLDSRQSILSQRRDPDQYPELTFLAEFFGSFRLYRDWAFPRSRAPRMPQPTDAPNDYLAEDASNLGLILNRLRKDFSTKRTVNEMLKRFYEGVEDIDVSIEGGTVQVFIQEKQFVVPATRMSDGTLRWLCLLTTLLHPSPPPVICIEEPELGLHPDMIPQLAELLRQASTRMQVVVTTHSDVLVDALTDEPEDVIVCEKQDGRTVMSRLSATDLAHWLREYSLGQLWRKGEIGGNRW